MKNLWINLIAIAVSLSLTSCAHESNHASIIPPSTGHIDVNDGSGTGVNSAKAAKPSDIPKPVNNNVFLPPPQAKAKEQTYSVVVNEVPVKEILFALARESKLNVDIHPSIQGKVTLNAVNQTLTAILERLAKQVDLTYKIEGNVLYIGPDMPVLRNYKIDYVNMNRDTTGYIGAASEIASAGRAASTNSTGSSTTSTSGAGSNSSRTSIALESKNHLWDTLVQNIRDLLAETDKEVIVSRYGTSQTDSENTNTNGNNANTQNSSGDIQQAPHENSQHNAEELNRARSEYKTLFASTVIPNAETGVISVRATARQHEKVQEFIDKVMSSAKKQVLIEATIVEVVLNNGYQAGIDWSRLGRGGTNTGFIVKNATTGLTFNNLNGTTSSTPNLVLGYTASGIGDLAASIHLLEQFGNTKVLSSPKLMVLNNQTAVLKVVNNLVYFTIQSQISQSISGTSGSNLQSVTTTPNTVPVGVVMSVTPQINDTSQVTLDVRPTISRVLDYITDPNPQLAAAGTTSSIPEIQVREMESVLNINSGNTAILGGLMQDDIERNDGNVPGFSKIPIAGALFKAKNNSAQKTELVIFLRPTVISNASLESDELQGYKQYLPSQQLQNNIDEPTN